MEKRIGKILEQYIEKTITNELKEIIVKEISVAIAEFELEKTKKQHDAQPQETKSDFGKNATVMKPKPKQKVRSKTQSVIMVPDGVIQGRRPEEHEQDTRPIAR